MKRIALCASLLLPSFVGLSQASAAPPNAAPQPLAAAVAQPATDLAVTDIFLDRLRNGRIWVRVTNHGPHPVHGRHAEFLVVVDGGGLLAGCPLHVAPGQTQTCNTGIMIDASQRTRDVTVTVRVPGMRDLRPANNTYRERVP